MMKKHTPWVAALVLLLALWLASCGGGQAGGGGGKSQTTAGKKAPTAHTHEKTTAAKKRTAGGASGGVIKTVTIKEVDIELSPSSVTLSGPGTYAFEAENDGATQHSLQIEGLKSAGGRAGKAKLKQASNPGQSGVLRVTFQKPGTYVMYCLIDGHEALGMKGEVVVK